MKVQLSAAKRRRLDLLEQVGVLMLYAWMASRLLPEALASGGLLAVVLLLVSEGVVCVLLLCRRPTEDISQNLRDWVIALGATFLPLLIDKGGEVGLGFVGTFLMIVGVFVHFGAKLTLLRSFGLVAANRGVKVGGMYAYVRHPMYAGYMLTHIGFLLASPSLWNAAVYGAAWTLLIARAVAEERILNQDPAYREYAQLVPHRIVPGVY